MSKNADVLSLSNNNGTELTSGWRYYLPSNLFAFNNNNNNNDEQDSSDSDDEPLDLSDEEIDASEAYDLMLGLPKDLSLSPPVASPSKPIVAPPTAIKYETAKKDLTPVAELTHSITQLTPVKTVEPIQATNRWSFPSFKPFESISKLKTPPLSPPLFKQIEKESLETIESSLNTTKLLEISYNKLRKGARKSSRLPLKETLLVHLTVDRIRELRKIPRRSSLRNKSKIQRTSAPALPPKPIQVQTVVSIANNPSTAIKSQIDISSISTRNIKSIQCIPPPMLTQKQNMLNSILKPTPAYCKDNSYKRNANLYIQLDNSKTENLTFKNDVAVIDTESDDSPLFYLLAPPISPPPKAAFAY
ncbi:hypothetical protein K502DRAFT_325508 [Neoconidiobolus thromboides FSU 785]|nr:hypothetical protein K502DRAFT_325508 [Neoconidiobolus thromboides FSU 785]